MIITAIIFFILYFIDQITKYFAQANLSTDINTKFIPNVMSFRLEYNTGAAFSSFDNSGWLLIIISGLATIVLGYFLLKNDWKHEKYKSFLLTMITAGCVGNLFDRIIMNINSLNTTDGRPGVVDMIDFEFLDIIFDKLFGSSFAVCNVADVYLVIGLILLAIDLLFFADRRKKKYEASHR